MQNAPRFFKNDCRVFTALGMPDMRNGWNKIKFGTGGEFDFRLCGRLAIEKGLDLL